MRKITNPKSKRMRQGGAALLWGLAFFIGGQVVVVVAMERWQPGLRDPEFGRKLTRLHARLAEQPEQPLLLMLGSSRTLQGFAPDCLGSLSARDGRPFVVFNFGLLGAGPLREWLCLRRLLEAGIRPSLLLVEVLPPLLSAPGPDRVSEEDWLIGARLSGADVAQLRSYVTRPHQLVRTWALSRLVPWYTHRLPILTQLAASWVPGGGNLPGLALMDRSGWQHFGQESVTREQRERLTDLVRRQYRRAPDDCRIGAGPRRALNDLLECCRQEKIQVALVLMPEASKFREWYSPKIEAALQHFLMELSDRYGVGLIDARTWVPDTDFWDSHHLLPSGARIFSTRLAECLVPIVHETPRRKEECIRPPD